MNRLAVVGVVLLSTITGVSHADPAAMEQPPATRVSLTVLSFNVLRDHRRHELLNWEGRRQIVLQVIRESAADLIALQETQTDQAQWLRENLPEYGYLMHQQRQALERPVYGGDVLYRKDRFTLIAHDSPLLPPSDQPEKVADWQALRGGTWATLRDARSHQTLAIFSVHLPHSSAEARMAFARYAVTWREDRRDARIHIIAGDYNGLPDDPAVRMLRDQQGYADPRLLTESPDRDTPTMGKVIVDYILTRGPLYPTSYRVIHRKSQDGKIPASDHAAILATFEFRE